MRHALMIALIALLLLAGCTSSVTSPDEGDKNMQNDDGHIERDLYLDSIEESLGIIEKPGELDLSDRLANILKHIKEKKETGTFIPAPLSLGTVVKTFESHASRSIDSIPNAQHCEVTIQDEAGRIKPTRIVMIRNIRTTATTKPGVEDKGNSFTRFQVVLEINRDGS